MGLLTYIMKNKTDTCGNIIAITTNKHFDYYNSFNSNSMYAERNQAREGLL